MDTATTALPRAVIDEVCKRVSRYETGAPIHVALKILEAAGRGETPPHRLEQIFVDFAGDTIDGLTPQRAAHDRLRRS
ncbi:hypothetical protein [Bradyrhizobium sp. CB3481]|uniref:hypothetical protein n=1 Tax=Bradyrhizobium sp. CB3481 TaxID=3039158 RepID=UPI0024B135CE|nr:hypothetical protein [Bradyrhizobium sp. CB3481]WFU14930.1 hypothetical protein QA643_28665 [Bradyrhizobium sp. CB3481]